MIFVYQRLVKIFNKSETPHGVGCWWPSYPAVSRIYPQKPQLNHTPHQTDVVFWGKGKGMAFHTQGLPVITHHNGEHSTFQRAHNLLP